MLVVGTLARWLSLSALAATLGALVVDVFILTAARPPALARRLRRWTLGAALTLGLGSLGELLVRTAVMAGSGGAWATAIQLVLLRTHFGWVWLARLGLIILSAALASRGQAGARVIALVAALGVALTTALTGHLSDWGDLTPSVGLDWIHVVSASAWGGGLTALALALPLVRPQPALLASVALRFSRLATLCLVVVVLTGAYNAWVQLPGPAALWTTGYGRVLAVKIALVAGVAMIGAINRWVIVARLAPSRRRGPIAGLVRRARLVLVGPRPGGPSRLPLWLGRFVTVEAGLALLVLGCTAVLGESPPPRHAGHLDHRQADEPTAPVRTTMEALHAAGGVPPGWLFAPPDGDAERGRTVFRRLQCHACHAVTGEDFPPPTGAGPDLGGMGGHHPAGYLAESVLNPNAVIVEGPGYTGPDGRSTMPDYRDSLSVSELIDLVAYLRGLR